MAFAGRHRGAGAPGLAYRMLGHGRSLAVGRGEAKLSKAGLAQPHMFDIHGGGIDLVFPHHENEVAQSRCANAHADHGAGLDA